MCRTPFIGLAAGDHETPQVGSNTEQVPANDGAYGALERLTAALRQPRNFEQSDSIQTDEHGRNEYAGMYS
jgi:hypothetical protein